MDVKSVNKQLKADKTNLIITLTVLKSLAEKYNATYTETPTNTLREVYKKGILEQEFPLTVKFEEEESEWIGGLFIEIPYPKELLSKNIGERKYKVHFCRLGLDEVLRYAKRLFPTNLKDLNNSWYAKNQLKMINSVAHSTKFDVIHYQHSVKSLDEYKTMLMTGWANLEQNIENAKALGTKKGENLVLRFKQFYTDFQSEANTLKRLEKEVEEGKNVQHWLNDSLQYMTPTEDSPAYRKVIEDHLRFYKA